MGADRIAAMRPSIVEVLEAPPAEDWCATFEADGGRLWVQVTSDHVNACYPFAEQPLRRIADTGVAHDGFSLVAWEARTFATFHYESRDSRSIARFVDAYFVRVLGCREDDDAVDISLERLCAST